MSTELRAMLERASRGPVEEIQIDRLWRRARRRSRVARFATTTALATCLAVSSVVVARLELGKNDPNQPSMGALGGRSDGQIDKRVLDSVAPVSGDSLESVRWMQEQMFRLKLPAVRDCLQREDRSDLLPDVRADFEATQNARMFQFPEPERLLTEGFISPASPFDKQGAEQDAALAESCTRDIQASDEVAADAQKLHQGLFEDWAMILVNDVLKSEDELLAQEHFGRCLRRRGVPEEFTVASTPRSPGGTTEDAFLGWVQQRIDSGKTSPSGVEDASLYVACGQPLWDTRERLLRERRKTYLEKNHDQLAELSDLLSAES